MPKFTSAQFAGMGTLPVTHDTSHVEHRAQRSASICQIVACALAAGALFAQLVSLNSVSKRVLAHSFALAEKRPPDEGAENQLADRASIKLRVSNWLAIGSLSLVTLGEWFYRRSSGARYLRRLPEITIVLLLVGLLLHFVII